MNKLEVTITAPGRSTACPPRWRTAHAASTTGCRRSTRFPPCSFIRARTVAALNLAGIEDGMRVLEVATGSGEMFRRLVRANRAATRWASIFRRRWRRARRRVARREFPARRAHCQAVDARHMPFRDHTFDAVVCCYLLELLSAEDILRTVGEFHRVLRDRGPAGAGADRPEHADVQPPLQGAGHGGAGVLGTAGGAAGAGS